MFRVLKSLKDWFFVPPTPPIQPVAPSQPKKTQYILSVDDVHPPVVGMGYRAEFVSVLPSLPGKPFVYLYNLSEQTFRDVQTGFGRITIPGKSPNERYRFVFSLPEQVCSVAGMGTGELRPQLDSGIRVAVDIINPTNLGTDLDTVASDFSENRDLSRKGVFYSLSCPPKEKDIKAAERRMKKFYVDLLIRAAIVSIPTGEDKETTLCAIRALPELANSLNTKHAR